MYRSCHGKNSCLNKEHQYGIQDTSLAKRLTTVAYSYLIFMKEFSLSRLSKSLEGKEQDKVGQELLLSTPRPGR